MDRPAFHFRQAQAAYDLISLVRASSSADVLRLGGTSLQHVVHETDCRFEQEADQLAYEAVAGAAIEATEHAAIAVAILVSNELQEGLWSGEVDEFAGMASKRIVEANPNLRSAILRALDTLEDLAYRFEPKNRLLSSVSRLTNPIDDVLPPLIRLAQSMDGETQKRVSRADYYDADKHLEALQRVLASDDCKLPETDFWYPSEVVELTAHVKEAPGFIECTALLLANAVRTDDHMGWIEFRWLQLAPEYNSLPAKAREAILPGIRFLYEANEEFLRYEKKFRIKDKRAEFDPILATQGMIQFVR